MGAVLLTYEKPTLSMSNSGFRFCVFSKGSPYVALAGLKIEIPRLSFPGCRWVTSITKTSNLLRVCKAERLPTSCSCLFTSVTTPSSFRNGLQHVPSHLQRVHTPETHQRPLLTRRGGGEAPRSQWRTSLISFFSKSGNQREGTESHAQTAAARRKS